MNSSSLWDVFAGTADTGKLLRAVAGDAERGVPTTVSQLARTVGLSQPKTHRQVEHLEQAGVLRTELEGRQRWVVLDENCPTYDLIVEALYRIYGVHVTRDGNSIERLTAHRHFNAQPPYEIQRLIPSELHPVQRRGARLFADDVEEGPSLAQARYWEGKLRGLRSEVGALQRALQDAYSAFHDERDRDMIHALVHVGDGLDYATQVISYASDEINPRSSNRMGCREWQLVCAAVRATVPLCDVVIQGLSRGVDLAQQRERERKLIADLEAEVESFSPDEWGDRMVAAAQQRHEERLQELEDRQATLAQIETDLERACRIGGITGIGDVGTGGERLIMARLRNIADSASAYADEMERLIDR